MGVGIDDPCESALFIHHHVGITIKTEEGRYCLDPLVDVSVVDDAALAGDIRGKQDFFRFESGGKQRLFQEGIDRHPTFAGIGRIDIAGGGRIAEFRDLGLDNHIVVGELTEIDFGPGYLDVGQADRRNILDEKLRQALLADPADRAEGDAVAVGEDQPLVDPVLAGQVGIGKFPR